MAMGRRAVLVGLSVVLALVACQCGRDHGRTRALNLQLWDAVRRNDLDAAEKMLYEGAEVDSRPDGGYTALQWAAIGGRKEMTDLLIIWSADVNLATKDGKTALDFAEEDGHKDVADLLRQHGGKPGKDIKG